MDSADLLTTRQMADAIGMTYDTTAKVLRTWTPTRVVGRNYLWSPEQLAELQDILAKSPAESELAG